MITQLLRRVERITKIKQKNAKKFAKKFIKKFGKQMHKINKNIQKSNKRYLERVIANSMAIKMVGYATLFVVISAGYQPSTHVADATWKSSLKLDTTKSIPVVIPEKTVNFKIEPIIPPAPIVVVSVVKRNTTARERAKSTTVVASPAPVVNASKDEIKAYAEKRSNEKFGVGHFSALLTLWNRESGWNYRSYNASSTACGIPQVMPCSKGGANFRNDPYKQVEWGLSYIAGRYGNPTRALQFWNSRHWY